MAEPHGRRCASFLRDGFLLRRPLQELEVLAGRDVVDGDAIASGFLLLRRSLRMHSDSSQNEQTHQDQYARNCAGHAFLLLPGLPAKALRMVPDVIEAIVREAVASYASAGGVSNVLTTTGYWVKSRDFRQCPRRHNVNPLPRRKHFFLARNTCRRLFSPSSLSAHPI